VADNVTASLDLKCLFGADLFYMPTPERGFRIGWYLVGQVKHRGFTILGYAELEFELLDVTQQALIARFEGSDVELLHVQFVAQGGSRACIAAFCGAQSAAQGGDLCADFANALGCIGVSKYQLSGLQISDLVKVSRGRTVKPDQPAGRSGNHHGKQGAGLCQWLEALEPKNKSQGK